MRAVLLASATAASFGGLRLRSSASHGDALPLRMRGIAIIDGKAVTLFDGLPTSASRACMDSGKRKRDRGPRLPPASQGGGWPSRTLRAALRWPYGHP